MSPDDGGADANLLIEQLRARASDPDRRTDVRPSVFEASFEGMSLEGMYSFGRSLLGDLRRVVQTNQAGQMPDLGFLDRATSLERDMTTPAADEPLTRATSEDVRTAEAALGVSLPSILARAYVEVANGGFGPGGGLLPWAEVVRQTRHLRSGDELPRGRTWPPTYVPLIALDPGWTCVDTASGAVIDWDPEDMTERMSEERFRKTFSDRSPSVEAWLTKWIGSKTDADRNKPSVEERWARMAARAQTPEGMAAQERKTYAYLAEMTPEDRAKWGFDKLYPDFEASQKEDPEGER